MAETRPEPSMEDILASIKRIIADDNPLPRRNYAAPAADPNLSERPSASPPPSPRAPRPAVPESNGARPDDSILELTNPAPAPAPPPVRHLQDQQKPWPPEDLPAVSRVVERLRQSEAASAQARAASMATAAPFPEARLPDPAPAPHVSAPPSISTPPSAAAGGMTLDELVRDMLRPMLSDWIDTHMPTIVERLVKQEMSGISDDQG